MVEPLNASVDATRGRGGLSALDRLAAAFLWFLLAFGSLAMWVAIPAGWLWVAGQITSDQTQHILLSLVGVPLAIILWARGLFWVNRLYMRVTMPRLVRELEEADDEEDEPRWIRGPLEPLLVGSLIVAIVAMTIWFFVFAERPPSMLSTS